MAATRYDALEACLEDLVEVGKRNAGVFVMEIGTYNGNRAVSMCKFWKGLVPNSTFYYVGFDLFEDMDTRTNAAELSKKVLPPSRQEVQKKIMDAGAIVELHKGNTRVTLPKYANKEPYLVHTLPDLIFIDGGHSLETIASDWEAVSKLMRPDAVVLFDDYYMNREDYGCKTLVTKLQQDPQYSVELLYPIDHVAQTGLDIRMVKVTKVPSAVLETKTTAS